MSGFRLAVDDEIDLLLRERRHAEATQALIDSDREDLSRWLPWVDAARTVEGSRQFIAANLRQFADGDGFTCGILYRGELVGMIGLHGIDWPNRSTSIGYWLASAHRGRGIATRACRAVVRHVFLELGLNRVVIRCASDNAASRAIPKRLGFREEGLLRQSARIGDRVVDMVSYALLASECEDTDA